MSLSERFPDRCKAVRRGIAPAVLICLNIFLFGTYAIYGSNAGEFLVSYVAVLRVLALPCLFALALLLVPYCFFGRAGRTLHHAALLLLAVMTYLHGNVLRWETGVLDGNALAVTADWHGAADLVMWFVLGWFFWRYRFWLWREGWKICALLALFQLIGHSVLPGSASSVIQSERFPPEGFSQLSREANILQVVLDGFQASIFEEILQSDSALEVAFDGFTFFRDALSTSDVTYLSVPASLTGKPFTNDRSISEYLEQSFGEENLYSFLADEGYVVDVASPTRWNGSNGAFGSYYRIPTPYTPDLVHSTAWLLLDMSLFRQVPYFLKSTVYRRGTWLISSGLDDEPEQQFSHFAHARFLHDLTNRMRADSDTPVYKFIHLVTPHAPFVSLADCGFAGAELEYSKEHFISQSRCTLAAVRELLQRLKALDVYGNSLIVIYGDHGGGVPFEMRTADGRVTTSTDSLRRVWGNPLPLVLIKPPLASGRVRISDQAVALTDIPATIADLLGDGGHPFPGRSMFAEPAERPRVRTFWRSLEHRNDAAAKDRFDTISRFDVTGSVYDLAAWSDEKLLQAPVLGEELTYRWGTDLTFGGQGTYKRFQEGGWSVTRAGNVTWTDGNEAGLSVPLPVASAQVRMRVMVKPFLVPGKLERQRVTVSVNGREITQWLLTESRFQSLDALIPAEALSRGEETAVRFILRDAAAPASLGTGKDRRKLALAFMSLRFDELASPESGGS